MKRVIIGLGLYVLPNYQDEKEEIAQAIKILEAFDECKDEMSESKNPREKLTLTDYKIGLMEFTNKIGQRVQIYIGATTDLDEFFDETIIS